MSPERFVKGESERTNARSFLFSACYPKSAANNFSDEVRLFLFIRLAILAKDFVEPDGRLPVGI